MQITIDRESWVPIYLQIAQQIRIMILEESLLSETQLPVTHDLSRFLGINRKTVLKAYRVLQREGLVEGRGRRGTFVTRSTGFYQGNPRTPWTPFSNLTLWQATPTTEERIRVSNIDCCSVG